MTHQRAFAFTAATVVLFAAVLSNAQDAALERARRVLVAHPVIDGHNDLPWAIRENADAPRDVEAYDLRTRTKGNTDLERLREGGVGGQFWSVYVPAELPTGFARTQLEQIDIARRLIARYPDTFQLASTAADIRAAAADIVREARIEPGPSGRLRAVRIERLGRLVLKETLDEAPSADLIRAALLDQARDAGIAALAWGEAGASLRARVAFLRELGLSDLPDLGDEALTTDLDAWLGPVLEGLRSLKDLSPARLDAALASRLDYGQARRLDALAPARWTAPTGNSFTIDYAAPGGPRVEVRVQEVFGLPVHPAVAEGRAPLTLALTSPAHRPIQTTRDLPGFWRGSWREVRAEMRGRYPRHVWPEDPASAAPTSRAKPRGT
jgi:HrpA-like RNA helicase